MLGAHRDGHNAWLRRFATVRDVRQRLEGALWRQSQQARCQGVLILRLGATVTRQGPELLSRSLPINYTSRPVRGLQSLSVRDTIAKRKILALPCMLKNLNCSNADKICPFYIKIMTAMMELNNLYSWGNFSQVNKYSLL